jgi:CubicO group peptidase (beta-lactamase class C family)
VLPDVELAAVRAILDDTMKQHRLLGMSIAIARGGSLQFSTGLGTLDLEAKIPVNGDTRYRIASVTKPITSVAVLQLAAAGKLDLQDAACDRCPAFEKRPIDPTIRHLLVHQSGLRHPTDEEDTSIRGAFATLADAIGPIANEELRFRPGEKMLYSSWGYAVLGCVIETVSGRRYEDYVRAHVLIPAGMKATVFDRPDFSAPDFSPGYRLQDDRFQPSEVVDTRFKSPASGLISTAPDLVRFALALLDDELLPQELCARMFDLQSLDDGSPTTHTLGWLRMADKNGMQFFYYGGSMEGTTALLLVAPERRDVLAILTNRERYVRQLFPAMLQIHAALID